MRTIVLTDETDEFLYDLVEAYESDTSQHSSLEEMLKNVVGYMHELKCE